MTEHYDHIVVLTGAGISAESGLDTFRDKGGLWSRYSIDDVATPDAYRRNPGLVHDFYNQRRAAARNAQPNPAHYALARLEAEYPGEVMVVTQNVDDLHERAGSQNLLHMHGELFKLRCTDCGTVWNTDGDTSTESVCGSCGSQGSVRPHIVWFGEFPFYMDEIDRHLEACDLFVSIGTSGTVYPAAGFVDTVIRRQKGQTVEINLEPQAENSKSQQKIYGKAGVIVPSYVEELLQTIVSTRSD